MLEYYGTVSLYLKPFLEKKKEIQIIKVFFDKSRKYHFKTMKYWLTTAT